MKRITRLVVVCLTVIALAPGRTHAAADAWTETKSAHFVVWSTAGDRLTRDLLWQLEQIRFAVATLWPWARVDLGKPMMVLAVRDEPSMKTLAPGFWEQKGGVRPVSVWVNGAAEYYMAIRADLHGDDTSLTNPYTSAYFSYVNLILTSSFGRRVPLWFSRGLAGVVSNTIIRDNVVLLGPPIPWHLEQLRAGGRLRLSELLRVTASSREYTQQDGLQRFDAQAWALVHFLMFGDNAARRAGFNKLAALLNNGNDPDAAFVEAFGPVNDLEGPFASYLQRNIYSYQKVVVDRRTTRDQFTPRPLPAAESAAGRAAFHVGMGRLNEARALIDEARKADASSTHANDAEALLLQRDNKADEAKAAFVKAAAAGSTDAYVYYWAAMSMWGSTQPDDATLRQIETYLARAVELNPLLADAYARLADVRGVLGQSPEAIVALLTKAIALSPSDPWIRISTARVLWRLDRVQDARKVAGVALALAGEDAVVKAEAERLLAAIPESTARPAPAVPPAPSGTAPSASAGTERADPNAVLTACQGGDASACRDVFPIAEKACAEGNQRACLATAVLQGRGLGVAKDEVRAFGTLERLCNTSMFEACTQWAVFLASDQKKPDLQRARALLTQSCSGGLAQACDMLKGFPK